MKIKPKEIPIREIVDGYVDNQEEGVVGYGGRLNIRPKYQREFIYNKEQRDAVIDTVVKGFPLNIMYWAVNDNGNYELLDGQQRTVSICQFIEGDFSIDINGNIKLFHSLTDEEKESILEYKLMVYICEGTEKDKLDWFKTINIAGAELTPQELRNAVYTGPWLTNAKIYFSKSGAAVSDDGRKYLKGKLNRQEYLETVIDWARDSDNIETIEEYMSIHQHDKDALDLWIYFKRVVSWVEELFPPEPYRKEMKGIPWGFLYNKYKDNTYDTEAIKILVDRLMIDDDVSNKKGIYHYVLNGEEKHLNIRSFTPSQKRQLYDGQNGICNICEEEFSMNEMEADHIIPWSEGGKTSLDNGQILCRTCNREKSNK